MYNEGCNIVGIHIHEADMKGEPVMQSPECMEASLALVQKILYIACLIVGWGTGMGPQVYRLAINIQWYMRGKYTFPTRNAWISYSDNIGRYMSGRLVVFLPDVLLAQASRAAEALCSSSSESHEDKLFICQYCVFPRYLAAMTFIFHVLTVLCVVSVRWLCLNV